MEIAMSGNFLDIQGDDYAVGFFSEESYIVVNTWILIPEEDRDEDGSAHDDGTEWYTAQLFEGVIGVE